MDSTQVSILVMGPGQNFLTLVGSIFCGLGRVGSAIYGLGLNYENFPKKRQIFQFLSLRIKNIASGRVGKYPGQSRAGLLFTVGQK